MAIVVEATHFRIRDDGGDDARPRARPRGRRLAAPGAMAEAAQAADALSRLHPRAFFERLLDHGVRPDGRGLGEARPRAREAGWLRAEEAAAQTPAAGDDDDNDETADASGSVRMGGTWVVCGIRVLVGAPLTSRPGEGWVDVNVHGVDDQSAELSRLLRNVVGHMIDLADLCLVEGVECMVLCVDVCCLADDGGVRDAAVDALSTALHDLALPVLVREDGDDPNEPLVIVETDGARESTPLSIAAEPTAHTFGIFRASAQSGLQLVRDPTAHERSLLDGTLHLVLDKNTKQTLHILKPDGIPLPTSVLFQAIDLALDSQ